MKIDFFLKFEIFEVLTFFENFEILNFNFFFFFLEF